MTILLHYPNAPTGVKKELYLYTITDAMHFQLRYPDDSLSDFVYCFSFLQNLSEQQQSVIIPNGKIDLVFVKSNDRHFQIALLGLETKPKYTHQEIDNFYSVSFHPLAIEYLFSCSVSDILDTGKILPSDFWGFNIADFDNFDGFCAKVTGIIHSLLPVKIDERKRKLFHLILAANGEVSVTDLAQQVSWSPRQINRYFKQQFGLSLKLYCKILRLQASLPDIKDGKLYPQLNFTDQSHFIKEIKQFTGVSPKELHKNENDRFLQFLVYKPQ